MTQDIDWAAVAAPLFLVGAGVLALLVDAFLPRARAAACALGVVGVAVAAGVTVGLRHSPRAAFCQPARLETPVDCSWVVDRTCLVWWVVVLLATGLVALLLAPLVTAGDLPGGETYFLLLCSASGALSVAAAHDLVTLVVAMETVSLPSFALVGLRRRNRRSGEAALKFFIVSVVSTAVSLLGISLVYGATGSVFAGRVATAVTTETAVTPLLGVGMVLTLVGLGFKLAVVPFQMWVPDTYVGAPVPVAAYLSVVSKVAGLAGIVIVVVRFFPAQSNTWSPVMGVAAALTMTVGNLAALRQRHVVRLLAWSSVAQAGFLLVPLAASSDIVDVRAIQAYAAMYAVVNLGAFSVVTAMSTSGAVNVSDYTGMVRGVPLLGGALAFALLCLAGLPPGIVGLVAKVVIFRSAVDGHVTWLALVMAVNVAIGLVYYLRFAAVLFTPAAPWPPPVGAASPPPAGTRSVAVGASPSAEGSDASAPASVGVAERAGTTTGSSATRTPATSSAVTFVVAVTLVAAVALSVWPAALFQIMP
jgi:NADH-quinone oxidoreductase subunit N